jgi:superfamily I DNA/RNA helicase
MLAGEQHAGVRWVSRGRFVECGHEGLAALQRPLPANTERQLRTQYFPESEIVISAPARRRFERDNNARLPSLFLDAQQEWASKLDLDLPDEQAEAVRDVGVRLINGVAGSGKTLIALSRALLLAEMHPDQTVLVLIHNTPIVADICERLHRARAGVPGNLEIATFSAWAHRQWRKVFQALLRMPADPRQLPNLVNQCRRSWPDVKLTTPQLIEEFDFLNEALIGSEAAYLAASRAGRGFALRPKERSDVWALFELVSASLAEDGLRMWSSVARDLCRAARPERMDCYDHVLVDEAQFFAPSWFQAVKLALKPGGRLFLCADPNQGFMKSRLSWRSAGLDVSGRTKKLRRSYRTTLAILRSASELLARAVQADPEDFLEPDFAGMEQGVPPILIRSGSPQDAVDRVANEIAALAQRRQLPLSAFLVIYGNGVPKRLLYDRLVQELDESRVWWLNKDKKMPPAGYGPDYLRLANLETATGLEAEVVFLLGMESLLAGPAPDEILDEILKTKLEADARKLYMAMTRASRRLVLVSTAPVPASAEPLFVLVA